MAIKTNQEQLEEIQNAISGILNGAQEAQYNGQKVRKADLDILYSREKELKRLVARENSQGIRVRRCIPLDD